MSAVSRSEERFINANGVTLCSDSFGDPKKPPVLLIMGLATQMIAWDEEFCSELAARGFYVVRFDNRDIGRSTHLRDLGVPNPLAMMAKAAFGLKPRAPYTLRDMAADTMALMDALGISRAHVVGASMGGAIAQELAIHWPARLLTQTCIMSSTGDPLLPPPTAEAMGLLLKPAPKDRDGYIAHHCNVLRILRGPHFAEDVIPDREKAARNFARGLNASGSARQFAAILASGNRTAALKRVGVPTLVIHGDADPLIRLAGGRAIAAAIAGSEFLITPGMGHSLPRALWPEMIGRIAAHCQRQAAA